jgi:hypothetical protein
MGSTDWNSTLQALAKQLEECQPILVKSAAITTGLVPESKSDILQELKDSFAVMHTIANAIDGDYDAKIQQAQDSAVASQIKDLSSHLQKANEVSKGCADTVHQQVVSVGLCNPPTRNSLNPTQITDLRGRLGPLRDQSESVEKDINADIQGTTSARDAQNSLVEQTSANYETQRHAYEDAKAKSEEADEESKRSDAVSIYTNSRSYERPMSAPCQHTLLL